MRTDKGNTSIKLSTVNKPCIKGSSCKSQQFGSHLISTSAVILNNTADKRFPFNRFNIHSPSVIIFPSLLKDGLIQVWNISSVVIFNETLNAICCLIFWKVLPHSCVMTTQAPPYPSANVVCESTWPYTRDPFRIGYWVNLRPTWVWVRPSLAARSARSGRARYWVCWKRWCRACSCKLE